MKKIILIACIIAFNLELKAQTVTDIDGNVYKTVTIGTQVWMAENLGTTKYNDSTAIPLITNNTTWSNTLHTPDYCWYNNTIGYKKLYGALYNFHTINTGKLCPLGWQVPDTTDWKTLETYLGGSSVAGDKMKDYSNNDWASPRTSADNSSGFSALPAGGRDGLGVFGGKGTYTAFWSRTSSNNYTSQWQMQLRNNWSYSYLSKSSIQNYGLSVRCIQESTTDIEKNYKSNKFNLYPNPSTDIIYIENLEWVNSNIFIYNLFGELVFQRQLSNEKNKIDISYLSKGIYIIKVLSINGTNVQKLIKE